MKNPDEKVKKAALSGEGLLTYLYMNNMPYHGVACVASVSVQFWKKETRNKSQRVRLPWSADHYCYVFPYLGKTYP